MVVAILTILILVISGAIVLYLENRNQNKN